MKELVYLSSPYSHANPEVVRKRFDITVKVAAYLLNNSYYVISPIVHGHSIVISHEVKSDWAFWKDYCELFLSKCSKIFVLQIPGWNESSGVKGEIEYALRNHIPIYLISIDGNDKIVIESYDRLAKLHDYAQGYTISDRPPMDSLVVVHTRENELVVGSSDFLGYTNIRVPFVKYEGDYYSAGGLEVVPEHSSYSFCRAYIKTDKVSDKDFDSINSFYVYEL